MSLRRGSPPAELRLISLWIGKNGTRADDWVAPFAGPIQRSKVEAAYEEAHQRPPRFNKFEYRDAEDLSELPDPITKPLTIYVGPVELFFGASILPRRIPLRFEFQNPIPHSRIRKKVRGFLAEAWGYPVVASRRGYHLKKSDIDLKKSDHLRSTNVELNLAAKESVYVSIKRHLMHVCHVRTPSGELAPFLMIGPAPTDLSTIARHTLGVRNPADLCIVHNEDPVYRITWKAPDDAPVKWFNFRIAGLDDDRPTPRGLPAEHFEQSLRAYVSGENLCSPLSDDWPRYEIAKRKKSTEQSVKFSNADLVEVRLPFGDAPVKVFLPADSSHRQTHVKRWLTEKYGWLGEARIRGSGRSFSVDLTPGSLPALSPEWFEQRNAVFDLPEWGLFRWRWPLDTPIDHAFHDIAMLLKKQQDQLDFPSPHCPGMTLIGQLAASQVGPLKVLVRHPPEKDTSVITVSFSGKPYPVPGLEAAAYVLELRAAVWEMIQRDYPDLQFMWRDLILSKTPDGGDPVEDGLTLEELGQNQLFGTVPTSTTVEFHCDGQVWQETFKPTDTVLEARKFASRKTNCQDLWKIQLFYAGRELRDSQTLSRLRMRRGNFITIVADLDELVLIRSIRLSNSAPTQYKFRRGDTKEEFTLPLHGADMVDRARIMVAAHCQVSADVVSLWFNSREILDDVMMDLIGLNPVTESIDVVVQDETELTASRTVGFDPLQASMILMASQQGPTDPRAAQPAGKGKTHTASFAQVPSGLRALSQSFRDTSPVEVFQAFIQSRQNVGKAGVILDNRPTEDETDLLAGEPE